jgi:hypothetical protein
MEKEKEKQIFFQVIATPELVDFIAEKVIEKQQAMAPKMEPDDLEKLFTVEEIAALVKKSTQTITRHCRLGLLEADKVGKSWLISKENYINYKQRSRT